MKSTKRLLKMNMRLGLVLLMLMIGGKELFAQQPHICGISQAMELAMSKDPSIRQKFKVGEDHSSARIDGDEIPTFVIPVVFHVMHINQDQENISMAQIQSQIDALNEDFGAYGQSASNNPLSMNAHIRFCLATVDPDGNPSSGVTRHYYPLTYFYDIDTHEEDMINSALWDPDQYLNIYTVGLISSTVAGGTLTAYTYYPSAVAGTYRDVIISMHTMIGREGTATGQGKAISHEVGHWLNLYHTWGLPNDAGCDEDDFVDDTPRCDGPYFAFAPFCPAPSQCDGEVRQIENFMDYSQDGCRYLFTPEQVRRMRHAVVTYRSGVVSSENTVRTACTNTLDSVAVTESVIPFPNPTNSNVVIYLDFDDPDPVDIEVWSSSGRLMTSIKGVDPSRGALPVSLEGFEHGVYWVVVRTPIKWYKEKFVLVK